MFEHGLNKENCLRSGYGLGSLGGENIEGAGSGECTFKALSNNTMEIKGMEMRKTCFQRDKEVLFDLRIK